MALLWGTAAHLELVGVEELEGRGAPATPHGSRQVVHLDRELLQLTHAGVQFLHQRAEGPRQGDHLVVDHVRVVLRTGRTRSWPLAVRFRVRSPTATAVFGKVSQQIPVHVFRWVFLAGIFLR